MKKGGLDALYPIFYLKFRCKTTVKTFNVCTSVQAIIREKLVDYNSISFLITFPRNNLKLQSITTLKKNFITFYTESY